MSKYPTPDHEGFFWGKLIHPCDGTADGDDAKSTQWEVMDVYSNYLGPDQELGPSGGPATREERMQEALRKAIQLADIANDWNLYEVEIGGEMVSIYTLRDEFEEAMK